MTANAPSREALIDFVYDEARLLDERRYDEWYDLFCADGRYWIPLDPTRAEAEAMSLVLEDKLLLKVRIERLKSGRAFSQRPASRCLHVLQRPFVEQDDPAANAYATRTPFLYTETRGEDQQVLACTAFHTLALEDGRLRIREKRVHLLNHDAALPSIQLFL